MHFTLVYLHGKKSAALLLCQKEVGHLNTALLNKRNRNIVLNKNDSIKKLLQKQ